MSTIRQRHGSKTTEQQSGASNNDTINEKLKESLLKLQQEAKTRTGIESCIVLAVVIWCCMQLNKVGLIYESAAMMLLFLSTLLLRLFVPLSKEWLVTIRSTSDTGMLFGTMLLPIVLASQLLFGIHQHKVDYVEKSFKSDDLYLWISIGTGFCDVAIFVFGDHIFMQTFLILVFGNLTAGSFQTTNSQFIGKGPKWAPWFYPLATMSLHVFLVFIVYYVVQTFFKHNFKRSFTIGELFFVTKSFAFVSVNFFIYSMVAFGLFTTESMYGVFIIKEAMIQDSMEKFVFVALHGGVLGVIWMVAVIGLPVEKCKRAKHAAMLDWTSTTSTKAMVFYASTLSFLLFISLWVGMLLNKNPILWVLEYTCSNSMHIVVVVYWICSLIVGLLAIHFVSVKLKVRLIIVRKLYHLLSFCMFVPAMVHTRNFMSLAFGVAFAALLLLEYVRMMTIPPFSSAIHQFMTSYTDERDEGIIILTHLYLLAGCAVPLWITHDQTNFAPFTGLAVLGIGDAAGAIVGSTFGKMRLPGGSKTIEGTLASVISTLMAIGVVYVVQQNLSDVEGNYIKIIMATVLTCSLEAFTVQIDNLILPVFYLATIQLASI